MIINKVFGQKPLIGLRHGDRVQLTILVLSGGGLPYKRIINVIRQYDNILTL